jgi:N-acyl-D-amino-acid deacylase
VRYAIAGGSVIDGTGAAAKACDIYVADGHIADVLPSSDDHRGWELVDARNLTIAPGFIDVHSHADNAPFLEEDDTSKILQGVTTEVVGNCGFSLAPVEPSRRDALWEFLGRVIPPCSFSGASFTEFLETTDRLGYVTNYAPLVGHSVLRIAAMGAARRAPTEAELSAMQSFLEESLDAGAFGLSSGLIYAPGAFADTDELVSLAQFLRPNTLYATHMRNEGDALLEAVGEALEIGRRAGVRVQISHHKAAGRSNWGKTRDSLRLIARARESGVDVNQDVYPYIAGSTMLAATLPPEAHEGGEAATLRRLRDPATVKRYKTEVESENPPFESLIRNSGYENIIVAGTASGAFEGESVREIAQRLGMGEFEALVRVLLEEKLRVTMIVFSMDEGDVERVVRDAHTVVGSDGLPPGFGGKPHPRTFGTFPRIIARYVRERGALSLEEAVRRMTTLPAQIFHIADRGTIAPGLSADLVAFDAHTMSDDLDYRDPIRPPVGIRWVMQNGTIVVRDGLYLGGRHGMRLTPATAHPASPVQW